MFSKLDHFALGLLSLLMASYIASCAIFVFLVQAVIDKPISSTFQDYRYMRSTRLFVGRCCKPNKDGVTIVRL
jgi:hypothetical protein